MSSNGNEKLINYKNVIFLLYNFIIKRWLRQPGVEGPTKIFNFENNLSWLFENVIQTDQDNYYSLIKMHFKLKPMLFVIFCNYMTDLVKL